eukprot:EC825170.1.p1 GENE.EC825170.1~~EC825170.1.p1  ORF type:complete len:156 (+),score=40.90 EC825170.1:29-496(+)
MSCCKKSNLGDLQKEILIKENLINKEIYKDDNDSKVNIFILKGDKLNYHSSNLHLIEKPYTSNDVIENIKKVKKSVNSFSKTLEKKEESVKNIHIKGKNTLFSLYTLKDLDLAMYARFTNKISLTGFDTKVFDNFINEKIINEIFSKYNENLNKN